MDELTIEAAKREVLGKKTRFLRRQGITPAHLFGGRIESLALQCDTAQLRKIISQAGMTRIIRLKIEDNKDSKSVFIRDIQRDSVSRQLLHVDFYQVRKGEKMRVDVPLVLVGEAPAMKGKGRMLTHGITSLHIECLPDNLPSQIEVDISPLEEIEQAIHVKDIDIDPSITVHADPDQLVVKVSEARVKVEEVEEVVEGVEEVEEVPAEETSEQQSSE